MKNINQLEKLVFNLFAIKPMLPGAVSTRYKICGKPNCRCAREKNPQKHIAHQLNYTLENNNSTMYVKKNELQSVREMTNSYKIFRKLTTDIALKAVEISREHGAIAASDIMFSVFEKARSKAIDGTPEFYKLRDAKISSGKWKYKALERQKELRKTNIAIRDLKNSRDNWRKQTMDFKDKNKELKTIIKLQQEKITALENSNWNNIAVDEKPRNFTYSLSAIRFAILMVIFGFNSLRGSAMNFKFFAGVLRKGLPTWTTIQNWILRFGLYKLLKPLPKRKDWIWIVDHTIEFGTKKCFVVLAVTHEIFKKKKYQLQHKDMEIALIDIQEKATGERISKVLKKLSREIGNPIQVVSDNGSNIKKGLGLFQKKSKKTIVSYDITHKVSNELKKLLEKNIRWNLFINKIAETKRKAIHSELAHFSPPKPREKSRWLNLDFNLKWAEMILENKHKPHFGRLTKQEKKFRELFGWLDEFTEELKEWRTLMCIVTEAQTEVKKRGLSKETGQKFEKKLSKTKIEINTKSAEELKLKITKYFKTETAYIKSEDKLTLLGTSDIIESIFGKYKIFSAKTPMKEIGKSVLTIPILTSEVTIEEVKAAMAGVSIQRLNEWLKVNIGTTLFSKRRNAYDKRVKEKVA